MAISHGRSWPFFDDGHDTIQNRSISVPYSYVVVISTDMVASTVFLTLPPVATIEKSFEILLNQPEIRLYLPFSG